jgi:excisionase family DNA binding protein
MLTAKEMQHLLQVDRSTIYRMAEQQRLPALKIGKQWRFPKEQVTHWLKSQHSRPQPEGTARSDDLAELLPLACVQLVQDTFADLLGVMLVITDMEGRPISQVSHPCGLFTTLSSRPEALPQCSEQWGTMAADLEFEPKFRPGHFGLLCARGLIRVGTALKGMVVAGGIAPAQWPPSPAEVEALALASGVTPATLRAHLAEVYHLPAEEQAKVLRTVARIATIIAHIVNEQRG